MTPLEAMARAMCRAKGTGALPAICGDDCDYSRLCMDDARSAGAVVAGLLRAVTLLPDNNAMAEALDDLIVALEAAK